MKRRQLLTGAAGTFALLNMPLAFASGEKWSAQAFPKAEKLVRELQAHPFVQGLMSGKLEKEVFLRYLEQDSLYLVPYARSLALLASRLTRPDDIRFFGKSAADTVDILDWTVSTYEQLSGKTLPKTIPVNPKVRNYIDWEANTCAFGSTGAAIAAMLPCFWIYEQLGLYIAKNKTSGPNPYQIWVDSYGTPEYSQLVRQAVAIADGNADKDEWQLMNDAFMISCQYEKAFFDAAMAG